MNATSCPVASLAPRSLKMHSISAALYNGRLLCLRREVSVRRFLAIVVMLLASPALGQTYRYEAESALPQDRHSVNVSTAVSGYSGTGYLTNFDSQANSDYFELKVDVPNGLYEMWVGYRSQYGPKGYEFWVDSEHGSGTFDQTSTFSVDRAGLFNVTGGINTLGIRESWGFYDVDYLEFRPYTPPAIQPIAAQLVDAFSQPEYTDVDELPDGYLRSKNARRSSTQRKPEPGISELDVPESLRRVEARDSQFRLH